MSPLEEGNPVGVISVSGCPGVAVPGSLAVAYAHRNGIKVEPLVGASSILLALMASGLNGQRFAFNGYLPVEAQEAGNAVRKFETESRVRNQTQIFIETPYRNNALVGHLIKNLHDNTMLCLAVNVTGETEMIKTQSVKAWKSSDITLPREPALFLFLSA
jgi:16S rRNA (cytidine1402-2'-O)-methyltransferase